MASGRFSIWCLIGLGLHAGSLPAMENSPVGTFNKELKQLVSDKKASAELVGLGAMVMQDGEIVASAVSGRRKKGSEVPLTVEDKWHIGSVTKSFTATMIARLVERGELSWETSIKDVFGGEEHIDKGWHDVTLEYLLTHTAGAPSNFPLLTHFKRPPEGAERMAARESVVRDILADPPASPAGDQWRYSNVGYTVAGVIAEKKTGLPWETLIRREVFAPLHLQSGGFGPPKDEAGQLDQPRGHRKLLWLTFAAGTDDDNTPIIGPAGTIHMTLQDLIAYGNEHRQGEQRQGLLLGKETYRRLHEPVLNNYAYGWVVNPPEEWANGTVMWHNGSNTMWYALLAVLPGLNAVMAVTSNKGDIRVAEQSAWDIIKQSALLLQDAKPMDPE